MMQGEICMRILSLGLIGHLIVSTNGFRPFPQWHTRHLERLNSNSPPLNYRGRQYHESMNSDNRPEFVPLTPMFRRQSYRMVSNFRPPTMLTPNIFAPLSPPPILPRRRRRPLQIVYLSPVPNSLSRTPVSPLTRHHPLPLSYHPYPHPPPPPPPPPPPSRFMSPKLLWLYMSHVPVVHHKHHPSFNNFFPLPVVKRIPLIDHNLNSLNVNNDSMSKAPLLENSNVTFKPSSNFSEMHNNQTNSAIKDLKSVVSTTAKEIRINSSTTETSYYETYEYADASTKEYDNNDNETAPVELASLRNKVPNKRKAEISYSDTLISEDNYTDQYESEDSQSVTPATNATTTETATTTTVTTVPPPTTTVTIAPLTRRTKTTASTSRMTTTRAPFQLKDAISWRKERSFMTTRNKEMTTVRLKELETVEEGDHTTPSSSEIENESLILHDEIVEVSTKGSIDVMESLSPNISDPIEPINEDLVMTNISLIHPLDKNMSVVITQHDSPANDLENQISNTSGSVTEDAVEASTYEDEKSNSTTLADESSSSLNNETSSTQENASGERFSRSQKLEKRRMSKKNEFGRRIPGASKRKGGNSGRARNEADIENLDSLADEEDTVDEEEDAPLEEEDAPPEEEAENRQEEQEDEVNEREEALMDQPEAEEQDATERDDRVYRDEEYYSDDYDNADENLTTDQYPILEDENYEDSSPPPEK